jgi:peptidoglycan/LPS O-acetylase OafA/YrhL
MMPDAANIKPLTALRFFAAFWVVMFHYWPNLDVGGHAGDDRPRAIWASRRSSPCRASSSATSICRASAKGKFRYGDFLWNRLARVYPLHLATLAGVGLMAARRGPRRHRRRPEHPGLERLPANLLLVHAWGFAPVSGWNHASWSISAEWFAYLTFPAFAFAAWRLRDRPRIAVGLALA